MHRFDIERQWAPLEMANAPGSDRTEIREAHMRHLVQQELGWTDEQMQTYWAGFLSGIEWYTSRMTYKGKK